MPSVELPSNELAFEEFLKLWRMHSYRMNATAVPKMARGEAELVREGLLPLFSTATRLASDPAAFEEGRPETICGEILAGEVEAPASVENQGIFFQPSLSIGPFPYGANLTYYFEYSLLAQRQFLSLPILGYALPGLRRLYAGGAPDCLCLCLTPTPHLYIQKERPIPVLNTGPIGGDTVIGFGLRKVPFSSLLDPPTIEAVGARTIPEFAYCVFVTINGKLIFSTLSPAYPIELQPFVNICCSAGPDSWNISGSPNHPYLFNLRQYIDEQETQGRKRCSDYDFQRRSPPSLNNSANSKSSARAETTPTAQSKANKEFSGSEASSSSETSGLVSPAAASVELVPQKTELPQKSATRIPYVPLSKHQVITTFDEMLLLPDITLFAYCYNEIAAFHSAIPGYTPWRLISKVNIYSSLAFTKVVEDPKVSIQKLSEYAQSYGLLGLLPPVAEWSRDRRELRRLIEHAATMSCSYLLAQEIGLFLSDSTRFNPSQEFVPCELSMRAKVLLLLPSSEYTDTVRSMPRISNWSIEYLESAYDEYRRKIAFGLQPEWTYTRERSFWLSLVAPITLMRALPKWKFSFSNNDVRNYMDYIASKVTQSPGARKKVCLFTVTSYIHLPFSLAPTMESYELLPLFTATISGLYEARRVARSRYQQYQPELAKFCEELTQIISAQELAAEDNSESASSSITDRAKLLRKIEATETQFQKNWGLQDYGTATRPSSSQDIAASLLWLFGDVPELTETIGIALPAQPFMTRLRSWFSSMIWEEPNIA